MTLKAARTKIVATIGPVSDSPDKIQQLWQVGVDVFRLNFSHSTFKEHKKRIEIIREITNDQAGILIDLPGPKIRIGEVEPNTVLLNGTEFIITTRPVKGNSNQVSVTYKDLPKDASPGQHISLADGLIQLRIKEIVEDTDIICEVLHGGPLLSRKGLNAPDVPLNLYFPTEKDWKALEFSIELDPDFYALSFVRRKQDVARIRDFINSKYKKAALISKIEHRDGLRNFDEILRLSDGIMVARGDLGVEIPVEQVPIVQKELVAKCRAAARPVIVATQVLSSMTTSPRPTRAEANDVANAILDGADALMLSEETASGNYPVDSVMYMEKIARSIEKYLEKPIDRYSSEKPDVAELIGQSTALLSAKLDVAAIITATRTGRTSRYVAKYRPKLPILAATPDPKTFKQLNLVWGVYPLLIPVTTTTDELILTALKKSLESGFIVEDDKVLVIAGTILGSPAKTNFLQVLKVSDTLEIARALQERKNRGDETSKESDIESR